MPIPQDELFEPIAVVGMSGRFPGARNVEEFWQNLCAGLECISTFSAQDLLADGVDPAIMTDPRHVSRGGVVPDADLFDAQFFGFSPREAEIIDPQQRLFLECAWEGLESAGHDPDRFDGLIGVYGGCSFSTYALQLHSLNVPGLDFLLGNDKDYLATRTAYKLNLKGPALTVQTACSTSLVAVCLAVQALRNFECDMAIAGGATISVPQRQGYIFRDGGILSPDGHCRTFDASAKGIVPGNGVAVVVLRRLSDALASGDPIDAVIKGVAVNNDGAAKVGFTAPSVQGQTEAIATALTQAGFSPDTIGYVEAHGTATPLGDPIEVTALTQVFGPAARGAKTCAIGSVKTNVGHLDSAAGVTGLIKAVLALKHGVIPKSLHFEAPNPQIEFSNSPFFVNEACRDWQLNGTPRRAGVSSFGIGGTNAHVVLEEAPERGGTSAVRPTQVITLSARSAAALASAKANLAGYLTRNPKASLADVAFTSHVGRKAFDHRCAVLCHDWSDAVAALQNERGDLITTNVCGQSPPQVVFMFPGQGTQHLNMGRNLYAQIPFFRAEFDRCADFLAPLLDFDLRDELYPDNEDIDSLSERLTQTLVAQPALFTIEYSLARLWMHWGVAPQAMIGHSIGELVAAALAGVFTFEQALVAVAARGQIMQEMPHGAMLAIPLSEDDVASLIDTELSIAAVNAPTLCVVAGEAAAVNRFAAKLDKLGVAATPLHTSHAFHSPTMDEAARRLPVPLAGMDLKAPAIPFASNTTGTWITADQASDPDYWGRHVRATVRFADGLRTVSASANTVLLEVGPGSVLSILARAGGNGARGGLVLASLPGAKDKGSALARVVDTAGKLWTAGVGIDWFAFHENEKPRRLPLPTYPFERQRYWVGAAAEKAVADPVSVGRHNDIAEWFYVPAWTRTPAPDIDLSSEPADRKKTFLLFKDARGLGAALAKELRADRRRVIEVVPGSGYRPNGDTFTIDPRHWADYLKLVRDLKAAGTIPDCVVHGWALTGAPTRDDFDGAQDLGFFSLLNLGRALGQECVGDRIAITVLSSALHAVSGEEAIAPEKATLLAACRGIPQEYPNLRVRSIDTPVPSDPRSKSVLVRRILAEILQHGGDPVVAYRRGHRWVQSFLPHGLGRSVKTPRLLRQGGVYLITGGLGEIGLRIAEELAQGVQAKLVLVGRTPVPPPQDWEAWLSAHDAWDPTTKRIEGLKRISSAGGEVLTVCADAGDAHAMRAAFDQATDRFGTINGIVHGAGMTAEHGFRMIGEIDRSLCEEHFRGKARGAQTVLALAAGHHDLDFVVFLSSISSILAGLGFIPYAAANLYLDALADRENRRCNFPCISINWDGWDFSRTSQPGEQVGAAPVIYPDDGMEAFRRILDSSPGPQVVVAAGDLHARQLQWVMQVQEAAPPPTIGGYQRPTLSTDYAPARNKTEQKIAEIWQSLLGINRIGIHDNFFELGGHSLLGIQVISRMRESFRIEISVRNIFDAPTISQLAAVVGAGEPILTDRTDRISRALDQVERLSEEEMHSLIRAQRSAV
jgi:acyl transferase domain-containing protein